MNRRNWIVVVVVASLLAIPSAPAFAGSPGAPSPRSLLCKVSVQRLSDMWAAMVSWGAAAKDSGDAVADAMKETLGSTDPSDLEVLEMQKQVAQSYVTSMKEFRATGIKDDMREILSLGSQIRSSVAASKRSYVKGRISAIYSLYKETWYDVIAPVHISGLQSLASADLDGWYAKSTPLPDKIAIETTQFERVFRGLKKIC